MDILLIFTSVKFASVLKFHIEFVDEGFSLRTQHVVRETVRHLSLLLNVRNESRSQVFRVPRDEGACKSAYYNGPNTGKCGMISEGYSGVDKCGGARIPPAHLDGLLVFGHDEVKPLPTSLPQGRGFTDGTNFVLYLTSRESKLCASALAHSQMCRTEATVIGGVHVGRPVAGVINVCWKEGETEDIVIRRVIVHELIHLLAMNKISIGKFVRCDGRGNTRMCRRLDDVIKVTWDRKVVVWSRHFKKVIRRLKICRDESRCHLTGDSPSCLPEGCGAYDGMVLGNLTRRENKSIGVMLASSRSGVHWSEDLFDDPTSVMVPKYVKSGHVIVDPLTLALFRTSGWYWVNSTVLVCINYFLNEESPPLNCNNLIENDSDSTPQNETSTGGMTTGQESQDTSSFVDPVNVSKDHEPAITSENVTGDEAHGSATRHNKFLWVKQQTKGLVGDTESEDVKSDASQCSVCVVAITVQIVLVYSVLKVIL